VFDRITNNLQNAQIHLEHGIFALLIDWKVIEGLARELGLQNELDINKKSFDKAMEGLELKTERCKHLKKEKDQIIQQAEYTKRSLEDALNTNESIKGEVAQLNSINGQLLEENYECLKKFENALHENESIKTEAKDLKAQNKGLRKQNKEVESCRQSLEASLKEGDEKFKLRCTSHESMVTVIEMQKNEMKTEIRILKIEIEELDKEREGKRVSGRTENVDFGVSLVNVKESIKLVKKGDQKRSGIPFFYILMLDVHKPDKSAKIAKAEGSEEAADYRRQKRLGMSPIL
jgi:CHASE3 domain sensor protein